MATGRLLSFCNPRLLRTVFLQLQQQQEGGLFCDVTLQGDGDGIHVHSCVIAACSPYLAKLLQCPTESSNTIVEGPVLRNRRILKVSGIPKQYLLPLVRYMYTSELEVAPANAYGVLKAAKKLRIPELDTLKLEGGRIVRPETGRKLNRGCFGSSRQMYHVKGLPHSEIDLLNAEVQLECTKTFTPSTVNNVSYSPHMLENTTSSQSLAETISKQNLLQSLGKSEQHQNVILKRLNNLPGDFPSQNSLGTVSEQNKISPEILIDLDTKDGGDREESCPNKGNGNQKRRKLNRGVKLDVSPKTVVFMPHSEMLKDNMIDMSETEQTGKPTCANVTSNFVVKDRLSNLELSNAQFEVPLMEEDSKSSERLTRGPLNNNIPNGTQVGESLAFREIYKKDEDDEYFGIADPTINYSNTFSALEDLSKAELDLTEIQKDTLAEKDFSNSEASTTCLLTGTADAGVVPTYTNVPSVHEVEKVKLRKVKNGLNWEIVKDMHTDSASISENAVHVNELEEFLEQMLNLPSPSDVDVGGCSPKVWIGEGVWPNLSSESDEEIDVLH